MSSTEFSSLYSSGDIILQNPIESSAIFLVVVVMCSSIEYLFSLAGEVDSKFFRTIFDTISEEVLVVGVLSLLLTFGSSVILKLSPSWSVMFQWAHICLLFMGIMFVALLSAIMFFTFGANSRMKKFELGRMRNNPDGFNAKEENFSTAVDKFRLALKAYGYPVDGVPLSVYLLKAEKKNLVELGNLSWKSWLALSTIVVLNALRTKVITQIFPDPDPLNPDILLDETGNIVNVAAFIGVCGYGTLGMFLAINKQLSRRLNQYLRLKNSTGGGRGGEEPLLGDDDVEREVTRLDLDDPQSFLLWQSWTNSIALVQIILMFLVWYSAVFFLNIVYQTFSFHIGLTLLFIVAAFVPLIAFVLLVPGTMTAIAILSTLGTNLNENWVKNILKEGDKTNEAVQEMVNKEPGAGAGGEGGAPIGKPIKAGPSVEFKELKPIDMDHTALQRLAKHHSIQRINKEQLMSGGAASPGSPSPARAQSMRRSASESVIL